MTRTEIIQVSTFMLNDRMSYKEFPDLIPHRLYYCKAWTLQSKFSKWVLLQSYFKIVAAYDKIDDVLYVFDYYSHTTCQHVAKFRNWLKYEFNPVSVKRVDLYNDSRTPKYTGLLREADDFASVIESALTKN